MAETLILPRVEIGRRHRRDGLGGVLDDVGERLGDQAPVEPGRHRILRQLELDIDVGMADPQQEHHLAHRVGHIVGRPSPAWACGQNARIRPPCA